MLRLDPEVLSHHGGMFRAFLQVTELSIVMGMGQSDWINSGGYFQINHILPDTGKSCGIGIA